MHMKITQKSRAQTHVIAGLLNDAVKDSRADGQLCVVGEGLVAVLQLVDKVPVLIHCTQDA